MQLTRHNVTIDELNKILTVTNGNVIESRVWVNGTSGKRTYIATKVDLGFLSIQLFSVDFDSRANAEEFLNSFEFDVKYKVEGCECE